MGEQNSRRVGRHLKFISSAPAGLRLQAFIFFFPVARKKEKQGIKPSCMQHMSLKINTMAMLSH